ncbi:MAG TPA: hypothetical protein VMB82_12000 [Acidimicrobiales bacterium]|nr:hypothetical protein [Acidimicrobiales bacterium]
MGVTVAEPGLASSPWLCRHCGVPVSRGNSGEWFHVAADSHATGPTVEAELSGARWRQCRAEDLAAFVGSPSAFRQLLVRVRRFGRHRQA